MAALQPSAEGQDSPIGKKSFSQLFSQPATSPIHIRQASVYKGEAAVVFSKADADKLAAPFQWALVGKFSHGRPSLEDIRKFFALLNLKDHVSIGLMDYRHVLIKCTTEADFNRIWMRGIWQLGKYPMRVFRWTREFHVLKESSLVPVWVDLPALPIHYFDKHSLFSIISPVGRPLFIDSATAAGTRPSLARVCVELDAAKVVIPRVWVAVEGESGFWQRIVPENMPPYCSYCSRLGHSHEQCKKNATENEPRYQYKQTTRAKHDPQKEIKNAQVSNLDKVQNPDANSKKTTEVLTISAMVTSDDTPNAAQCTDTVDNEGKPKGVIEEEVRTAKQAENDVVPVHQDDKSTAIIGDQDAAIGDDTSPSPSAVHGYSDSDHTRKDALDREQGEMENQLEKAHENEYEGTHSDLNKHFREEHQRMADRNSLQHLYVELCGPQNTFPKEHGIDVNQLPISAANLSPTLADPQETLPGSSSQSLKIDQSGVADRNSKQKRTKDQHISLEVQSPQLPTPIIISFVHAKCSVDERRNLWSSLLADKPSLLPWCIGGDFNVVLAPHEKCGGRPFVIAEGVDFMSFMEEVGVFDVGFSGARFTWSNNRRSRARISKRLDRFLVNGACLDFSDAISVLHLARHPSDHSPLKISFVARSNNKPRPFRFLNVWTTKPEFLEVIRQAWNQDISGSPLRVLCSKLLATRRAIQAWNKQHFGNVFDAVRSAEMAVQRAEESVDNNASEECQIELNKAQAELRHALSIEEQFWRQKARVKWLCQGDSNSKYFHAIVRQRRSQGMIHRIKNSDGVWVDNEDDIASAAITYFHDLFNDSLASSSDMLSLIPPKVSGEDNAKLEEVPSIEEVHRVLRSMDEESAAGPDGFTGKFFTFAWQVIAQDVYKAVLSFFCGAELPRFITSTSIVLIPKVQNPQDFSQFRPISLCNFFNKLLSRILADRVADILPKIISPHQTGFVKGRNITENFLLAQEVISGMAKKNRGGNVVMKLDMSKAYDRVAWSHIINVLRRYGFGERFIDMVWRLISNAWFSIIINGSSYGFFKSSRGLRQGDPLSPALFIIGAEALSRALNNLTRKPGFVGFKVPYGCPPITHLAFADDILIFANGSSFSLKAIMQVLEAYQRCSGQLINVQKSCYLIHPSMPSARRRVIDRITRFAWQSFPIRYLGFPLYFGRCKSSYFGEVCQSILARILSWKSRLLSFGAFSCKLWWNFRTGSSLWSTFMKAKYCKGLHPCQVELRKTDSSMWRRMTLPRENVFSILEQMVPEEGNEVEVIWMPTTSGKFSLKSAFGDIRQARPTSMVFASIWHSRIPVKVSFFMLRLLLGRIPIPDQLCKLGFHLPSKCFCCSAASEESIEHLFSNGHIATVIWNYFGGLCGLNFSGSYLRARIVGWWLRSHDYELRRFIDRILPSVVCWQIWKARNKAMFEGIQMRSSAICQAIFAEIRTMVGIQFKKVIRLQSFSQLYDWKIPSGGRVAYKVIRWETKETGRYILNTDGCAKGNPRVGGGGGVLRDSTGLPLIAFSAYLGETTSLRAEARALLIGLQTCIQKGFEDICVQSDSLVLIGIIQRRTQYPWQIRREVNQIWKLVEDPARFSHCYREANTVADALSNVGISHPQQQIKVYDTFSMFPRLARGAICLDRLGMPSLRKITNM
ncbi:uncharacterized protein [Coffea arabica]|uniref:Reverse transcriptase domain-containing protein n=1 Tax=Coffea arabica TaxID=13443 RepID=A0A6P6WXY2_COFAR